ncbi:hypothetical protein L207DRAFT_578833 [Hyaloscypha variabilis F]|uniref:Uncharacterized protein n=1 Tax=Hyaloscypha variabilis (strain UAMH 11265 / GT02V1 / F) TaxID=1149755 RepID=A0A2J6RZD5_HYAVF|nr:hypothetical protein L207DRAFT_578833 [Hyaloscypha variabilis F]
MATKTPPQSCTRLPPFQILLRLAERAHQHPELSCHLLDNEKESSPQKSTHRGSGSHASGRLSPHKPHCYRTRPSGLALIQTPSTPNDKEQGYLVRDLNPPNYSSFLAVNAEDAKKSVQQSARRFSVPKPQSLPHQTILKRQARKNEK